MLRRAMGRFVEWALGYVHTIKVVSAFPTLPISKYRGDAGYDLYCSERTVIPPHTSVNVPSATYIQSDDDLWFALKPRSSTMRVKGLQVIEAVIDNDYTGEMFSCVYNPSDEEKVVEKGERIVQIVPMRLVRCSFRRVDKLDERARGDKGFGSTGR